VSTTAETPAAVRLELLDLHARLAQAIDSGDAGGWADLFAADGVLRTSRPRELHGREQLARFAAEWFGATSEPRRHVTWHHRFEGAGNEVEGRCYAAVLRSSGGGVGIEFTALYHDRFRRHDGRWLLRERDVAIDSSNRDGE